MTNEDVRLKDRLDGLLAEERKRREERGRAKEEEMVALEAQMDRADELADRWAREVILPRLAALGAVFPNGGGPTRSAGGHRVTLRFAHSDDFPVYAGVEVSIERLPEPGRIRVAFEASILPILMDFSSGDAFEIAAEEPDEPGLARFLDECVVRFATDYMRVRDADSVYQRSRLVTDPVCGMVFRPAEAAATSDYGGETWHFCATRCLERFAAEPERYARRRTAGGQEQASGRASKGARMG